VKKLIETIISGVMNALNKRGYSTTEPGSGIGAEQYLGKSGGAGGQGKGRGGGRGQGGGKGGGGCGGKGSSPTNG
jgi:hypothetical protein